MPTTEELAQLEKVLTNLTPISHVQPGERIESLAWNTLVDTVIRLARAVYTSDDIAVEQDHQHTQQVKVGWLDPQLRSMVEQGPSGSPDVLARIRELERRIDQLARELKEREADQRVLRDNLGDLVRKDLIRERDITVVRRGVEAIADPRDEINTLRQSLNTISQGVNVAVDLNNRLGRDFDAGAIDSRLTDLETLRASLTTPGGDLLNATQLETRLTELTNTLVTEAELDAALASRIPETTFDAGLEDRLRVELTNGVNTTLSQSLNEMQANVNLQLSGVPAMATRAVADALPDVQASLQETTANQIATAIAAGEVRFMAALNSQISGLDSTLRADYTTRINNVQAGLSSDIKAELDAAIPAHLAPINTRIDGLDSRVTTINNRATTLGQTLSGRINELIVRQDSFELRLSDNTVTSLAGFETTVNGQLANFRREIEAENTALRTELQGNMTTVATNAANSAVSGVSQQLRGEMRTIARNEFNASRTTLNTAIRGEVDAANANISSLIDRRVRSDTSNLSNLVRREVEGLRPAIDSMVNDRLRGATNDLTLIQGLSSTDIAKLRAANVTTAADLARMTPQTVARLLGTSTQRLSDSDVIGQAQRLGRG